MTCCVAHGSAATDRPFVFSPGDRRDAQAVAQAWSRVNLACMDACANAINEIRHLSGNAGDCQALDRIRALIEDLRDDQRTTEPAREKLLDALNWFEVLFSEERRRRFAAPGGTDGVAVVKSFALAELQAAESELLRSGGAMRARQNRP